MTPPTPARPAAAVLAMALLLIAPHAAAHTFQTNMYPDLEVTEDGFVMELWVATFLFPPLAQFSYGDGKPRPEADAMREEIVGFMHKTCPIAIDGEPTQPELDWLKFEEMKDGEHLGEQRDFVFAKIRLVYGAGQMPRRVNIRWGMWFPEGKIEVREDDIGEVVSHDPNVLDMLIFAPGGEEAIYMTPDDPEVTWHAPLREFASGTAAISDPAPAPAPARTLTLPLMPILAGVATLVFVIVAACFKVSAPVLVGGLLVGGAAAALTKDVLPIVIPHPAGGAALAEFTEAEAADEFLKLHRGIYRAFEAESEDAIYNRLASSVDGALLDRLYEEVYHSLVMRSEGGGALSRVSSVDYVETTAEAAPGGDGFVVACTWRVKGIVRHWGHAHRRTNEYQADYRLAQRDDRWTIIDATINLQKRVPDPENDAPPGAPQLEIDLNAEPVPGEPDSGQYQ